RRATMAPCPCLFAVILLLNSVEMSKPPSAGNAHAILGPALSAVAIDWELMDRRETEYLLAKPDQFASDLKLLQERYRDLAAAPLLHECKRFPDRDTVCDLMAFNRGYRDSLAS